MNYDEVLSQLDTTITYISKRHKRYVHYSTGISMLNIVLSSTIPILITLAEDGMNTLLLVSIFSALITLLQTFKSTFKLESKIQTAEVALAALKKEQLLFATNTSPYNLSSDENVHALMTKLADQTDNIIEDFLNNK